MQKTVIYGARSFALSAYRAIELLYPETECIGFAVSSLNNNPKTLAGKKVWELSALKEECSAEQWDELCFFVATPENLHKEIKLYLEKSGVKKYIFMDSETEKKLMQEYYDRKKFPLLSKTEKTTNKASIMVYQVKSSKDMPLENNYELPGWIVPVYAGSKAGQNENKEVLTDYAGDNIADKNGNYCELTVLYWLWKNGMKDEKDYYGLFHYRRILDITEEDLYRMDKERIDVILPFPTIHEPDIREHHSRYIKESDWENMCQALLEIAPEYARAGEEIFSQEYFCNYNIMIARKEVMEKYCEWLFPILERIEILSGYERRNSEERYIGYLGESLLTLYFAYHKKDLNIVYAGRRMLI